MDRILFRLVIASFFLMMSANASVALLAAQDDDTFRKWTAANNKFSVSAKLLSCDDNKVKLESKEGKIFNVDVGKLCEEDQAYVENFLSSDENPFTQGAAPTGRKPEPKMESDEDGEDDFFGTGFGRGSDNNRSRKSRRSSNESSPSIRVPKAGKLKFGRRRMKLRSGEYAVDVGPAEKLNFDSDTIDFIDSPSSDRYAFHNRMGDWGDFDQRKVCCFCRLQPF